MKNAPKNVKQNIKYVRRVVPIDQTNATTCMVNSIF